MNAYRVVMTTGVVHNVRAEYPPRRISATDGWPWPWWPVTITGGPVDRSATLNVLHVVSAEAMA